ncbi:uncharacterized protein LOC132265807 isoform X2 [Phlebotomus argentipes]|uniref:uncharacterized protein LOC132265807 isoform X2 n=1 Tax=Phlebotomus argentipes TaxID=94469 RepID=UPI002892F865|nr:uncharacterized protein LOC132265807 isoform X2 [Phlebotomus argentipes]
MHCQEQDAKRTWNRRRDLPRGECRGCMDTKRAIIKVERKEKWPRFSPDDAEERHKCSPCAANTAMLEKKVSRELRSSILYTVCECGKRNGLQDDCRKSLCQGRSSCLKKPEPECLPARYYRRKNDVLERKIGDGSGIKRESHEYSRPSTPKKVKFEEGCSCDSPESLSDC